MEGTQILRKHPSPGQVQQDSQGRTFAVCQWPVLKSPPFQLSSNQNQKKNQHKDKRHLVQVWSGHKASITWLNILNFKEISHYYVENEKILIVENRT